MSDCPIRVRFVSDDCPNVRTDNAARLGQGWEALRRLQIDSEGSERPRTWLGWIVSKDAIPEGQREHRHDHRARPQKPLRDGNSLAIDIPRMGPSRFQRGSDSQGRQETTREGTRRTENSAAGSHNATRTRSSTTRLDWTQDQWGNGGVNRVFGLFPVMDYTNSSSYDPGQRVKLGSFGANSERF